MASSSWMIWDFVPPTKHSGRRIKANSSRKQSFRRLTKLGILLVLVIIVTSLPLMSDCRPVGNPDHVYTPPEDAAVLPRGVGATQRRFPFERRLMSPFSNNSDTSINSENVHSVEILNPLLNNSSMIVHVIVTSSSSSSTSEHETDSELHEIPEEDIQYTVAEDIEEDLEDGDMMSSTSNSSLSNMMSLVTRRPSPTFTSEDLSNPLLPAASHQLTERPVSEPFPAEDQLELKRIRSQTGEPVDIFSAFYRAFTHPSSVSPGDFTDSSFASLPTLTFSTAQPPTEFTKPQRRRSRPNSGEGGRRRVSENEGPGRESKRRDNMVMMLIEDRQQPSQSTVEETARKLELLARKIDKSYQGQSHFTTEPPIKASSVPPKFAVSVAVSHSQSVAAGKREKASASSPESTSGSPVDEVVHARPFRQKQRIVSLDSDIRKKNDSTFTQRTRSVSSQLRRRRPLRKSLPRIHDKSESTHNFSNRFTASLSPINSEQQSSANAKAGEDKTGETISFSFDISEAADADRLENFHNSNPKAESSSLVEITTNGPPTPVRRKITRTVNHDIEDPSSPSSSSLALSNRNGNFETHKSRTSTTPSPSTSSTTTRKVDNWQQPEKVWSEPARVWGEPAKVWSEPAKVWGEPEKVWGEPAKVWSDTENVWRGSHRSQRQESSHTTDMMQSDQPPEDTKPTPNSAGDNEDELPSSVQGTFVILGDDDTESDSVDGDLSHKMLHHDPPSGNKQAVVTSSISTSISSSSSSITASTTQNKETGATPPFARKVAYFNSQIPSAANQSPTIHIQATNASNDNSDADNDEAESSDSQKKSGKKFGYVIEGANVRKYRVEERTSDGYIVGEYGVLNNQNAFLRGVRYTADGTINPRLIHEALMKFLSLRR